MEDDKPFQRVDENPGFTRWLKIALMLLTVTPIRLLLLLAVLSLFLITLMILVGVGAKKNMVLVFTRSCASLVLFLLGFQIDDEGFPSPEQRKRDRVLIIVCNHVSFLEVLYFMSTPFCPSFVMKQTCLQVPVVGYTAVKLGGLLVDRTLDENASKPTESASEAILQRVEELKRSGEPEPQPLLIFVEGTTTNGEFLMPFKSGAFRPAAPVLPVLVSFPFERDEFSPAYESIATITHLFRLLTQWRHKLKVKFLPLQRPSKAEQMNPKLFARNVRLFMAKEGELQLTNKTYADKLIYHSELMKCYKKAGNFSLFRFVRPDLVVKQAEKKHT